MLFIIANWLKGFIDIPGIGLLQYITFRAAAAAITALLISLLFGPWIIKKIRAKQIGEQAKLELTGVGLHQGKAGTPTMGGLIVLLSLLLPTLLWADVQNIYVILIFLTTAMLGFVGFLDDYLKVIKKMPKGLIGKYKIVGQVIVGLMIGCSIYFHRKRRVF